MTPVSLKMVKQKTSAGDGPRKKSQPNLTKKKKKLSKSEKETNKQVDKVEAVKLLVSKYGMTNIDALIEYDKFFKKYPSGLIKKGEFLEEYKVKLYSIPVFVLFELPSRTASWPRPCSECLTRRREELSPSSSS